jgi:four helix bundle protein
MYGKINNFTDLNAWKEGHKLVVHIYDVTKSFPQSETFGMTSQMRRCVVSITSNVAEGFSRKSSKEKRQFYSMSQGSLTELQNLLLVGRDVGYISENHLQSLFQESTVVQKIINGLIKSAKNLHNA